MDLTGRYKRGGIVLKKIEKVISHIINIVIVISLTVIVLLVFGNTFLRYVFNSGISGSVEITRYLFIWIVFLGSILALRNKKHIAMELPYDKFPHLLKKIIFIIGRLLMLFLVILIFEGGYNITKLNLGSVSPSMGVPLILVYSSLMVVSLGMALIILIELYQAFTSRDYIEKEFKQENFNDSGEDE